MEENEVVLSLGLSIGGSFRKFEKPVKGTVSLPELKSDITSLSNSGDAHFDSEQKKREIHAFRRQEAKRKREDKKKRGRIVVGSVDNNSNNDNNSESDGGSEVVMKKRLCRTQEEIVGGIQIPVSSSAPAPAAFPVEFGRFSNVQFVNFGNGFVFPYHMLPCWAPAPGEEKSEKNVYYPVASRPVQGFPVERGNGGGVKSGESSGAAASSSSAVSESRNGMSSSRETSHSVESKSNQQQLQNSLESNAEAQSEHSDSPHRATEGTPQVIETEQNTHKNKTISPKTTTTTNKSIDSIQRKTEEEESNSIHKPSPPPQPPSDLPLMKKSNGGGDSNKPPKPQSKSLPPPRQVQSPVQRTLLRSQSLPQMPCVSTTGDGPNGKKINGFLYKYSKTEVNIMCVCHGSSFTPAEFVKHAGGTDVSHPLKRIVVVPSAF